MALYQGAFAFTISQLLPRAAPVYSLSRLGNAAQSTRAWSQLFLPLGALTIPTITVTIPGIFSDIWEGILRAVPKKKTSHMKKRHRQLAGKALKDVRSINSCPGCGRPKKAHHLCPYCVAEIREGWKQAKLAKDMGQV